jgi:hypothetical protein
MRLSRALLSAVALAAASPLGAVPLAEEGFRVPRESLKTDLKKFCLREVGGDLPRAYFRTRFLWLEQFAAKLLSRAGFESMPSERVEAALAVARTDAGGFYDPFTGRAMAAKREAVANAERLALTEKLGCDATLALELHLVRMRWQDGIGSWDYVQRPMGGGALYVGTGQALSLWLEMRSIQGMALVERAPWLGVGRARGWHPTRVPRPGELVERAGMERSGATEPARQRDLERARCVDGIRRTGACADSGGEPVHRSREDEGRPDGDPCSVRGRGVRVLAAARDERAERPRGAGAPARRQLEPARRFACAS